MSTTRFRKPINGSGSSGKRTPRSMVYGKWKAPAALSSTPMSTTCASKSSWILSPTKSYIDCMSRFWASPCWTLLIIASSAARSSVWPRRRFVSSKRRALSSATLRLVARVLSTRTSRSLNALVRSRFWSEMRPVTLPPDISGAKSIERAGSPWMTGHRTPCSASHAGRSPTRIGWPCISNFVIGESWMGVGSSGKRTPRSIVYG